MYEFIKEGTRFDFMGSLKPIMIGSLVATIIGLYGIFGHMNYGVDFRGGAQVQAAFSQALDLEKIRETLDDAGLKGISVQTIGEEKDNSVLINVQADGDELNAVTESVTLNLHKAFGEQAVTIQKIDIVGPKAGSELRVSAVKAMFWAILAIMIYIGVRFDLRYAPGTMISIIHDVILVAGIIAFTGMEFSLQIVGALLALIGYSVNDTVVIYDRIRETEINHPTRPLIENINDAINHTLSRTLTTGLSTLILCVVMYLFAGGTLKDFFFVLSIGIIIGTYSTIYVAAGFVVFSDYLSKRFGTANKINA